MRSDGSCRPIWIEDEPDAPPELYVMFRRQVELPAAPVMSKLSIFADSRYTLWINGQSIGRGPARFDPRCPEYDLYENTPSLRAGANTIAVLVRYFGLGNFRWIPAGAGLCVDLEIALPDGTTERITSDASWRASVADAYSRDASRMSIILPANEEFDARQWEPAWITGPYDDSGWLPAVPVDDNTHGPMQPRSIPLLCTNMVWSDTLAARGRLDSRFEVQDIRTPHDPRLDGRRVAALVGTFLHSPGEQDVSLAFASTGPVTCWVEGRPVKNLRRAPRPAPYRLAKVHLREGWNWLVCRCESSDHGCVTLDVGLSRGKGLVASGIRQQASPNTWWLLGPVSEPHQVEAMLSAGVPEPMPSVPSGVGATWAPVSEPQVLSDGGVDLTWSRQRRDENAPPAGEELKLSGTARRREFAIFDLGEERLGRPVVELRAKAGTVLEMGYAECLEPDGRFNPTRLARMVDRYTCREGEQRWETFDARGGRYLMLAVGNGRVRIGRVGIEEAGYPVESIGQFACSDPLLERIWEAGRRTVALCMEDAYTDCPGRERAQWLGDARVSFRANLAAFGDHALLRRVLRQFAQSQTPDGRIAGVCPNRYRLEVVDYMLVWVATVQDYYHFTGDRLLVEELFPAVQRVLGWFHPYRGRDELLVGVAERHWVLLDWADVDRRGAITCLNAMYVEALRAAAEMGRLVGAREEAVASYRQTAGAVARALRRRLWMPRKKRFADCRTAEGLSAKSAIHSNAMPLRLGGLPAAREAGALAHLKSELTEMFHPPKEKHQHRPKVSPYFMYYVLDALYATGEDDFALSQIRNKYGWMLEQGAQTLWEHFDDRGSLCHGWSAGPTYFLSAKVLGVEFLHPGQVRHVTLRPHVGDLQWARGVWPHPDGPIQVAWKRTDGGGLEVEARLPRPMRIDLHLPADLVFEPVVMVGGQPQQIDPSAVQGTWLRLGLGQRQEVAASLRPGP